MSESRRGWSGNNQMRPASEYDIRYGHQLLKSESSDWPSYLVVTTPTAHKTARSYLSQEPLAVAQVISKDAKYVDELVDGLPNDADLVIGLGGGTAVDVSKYVAIKKDLPLVLVPTVVSSGAIIHGNCGLRRGIKPVKRPGGMPWVDCERVLVDYDLVLDAPDYMNTAGLGDILCGYAGLAEWRRNSRRGIGVPWDEEIVTPQIKHHKEIVQKFPETLDDEEGLTPESVHFILTALQERDSKSVRSSAAPAGDHAFVNILQVANDKYWIHGEGVALGAVIIAWQCDENPEMLVRGLEQCKVRWRPKQMGISREELRKALEYAPHFMANKTMGGDVTSIIGYEPIVADKFDCLWEFLGNQ